jgi:transposase
MFGDEASFWLDGSLHRTWARIGVPPHVDTYGLRKTAHVFGALSLEAEPQFDYRFAPVFNGDTFLCFLQQLVARTPRKVFLIVDNGPCHNLKAEGKAWLARHRHRIELFRLPPYSPTYNPTEGAWKETKKRTTHNRFFQTVEERDAALVATFAAFQADPRQLAGHVRRFLGSGGAVALTRGRPRSVSATVRAACASDARRGAGSPRRPPPEPPRWSPPDRRHPTPRANWRWLR